MQPELSHRTIQRLRSNWSESSVSTHGLRLHEERELSLGHSSIRTATAPASTPSLQERVFNALAQAKIWTSTVAMHMPLAKRDRFFRQLDLLHDCDEWFDDGKPVSISSYQGFVTLMLLLKSDSKPSLGLAPDGKLVAVWQSGDNRLTLQFKDRHHVDWMVRRHDGGEVERAAGTTTVDRVTAVIAPYHPETWLGLA